jgi:3-isopropylmalate/(R)-2-methylmalate dehydratase small subunit
MMPKAWVFDDDVDTDQIIAGRYLVKLDPGELAKHAMEAADPEFASKVRKGDVIIAGRNFGCGSSRERAPLALKAAGVSAVVAESFARIYYRNAINLALPALISPGIRKGFKTGDEIKIDMRSGEIHNLSSAKTFKFEPLPEFLAKIVDAGGLLKFMTKQLREG